MGEMEMVTAFAQAKVMVNVTKELGGHTSWLRQPHLLKLLKLLLMTHAWRSELLMLMVVRILLVARQLEVKIFDMMKRRLLFVLRSAVVLPSAWVLLYIHGAPCSSKLLLTWNTGVDLPSLVLRQVVPRQLVELRPQFLLQALKL